MQISQCRMGRRQGSRAGHQRQAARQVELPPPSAALPVPMHDSRGHRRLPPQLRACACDRPWRLLLAPPEQVQQLVPAPAFPASVRPMYACPVMLRHTVLCGVNHPVLPKCTSCSGVAQRTCAGLATSSKRSGTARVARRRRACIVLACRVVAAAEGPAVWRFVQPLRNQQQPVPGRQRTVGRASQGSAQQATKDSAHGLLEPGTSPAATQLAHTGCGSAAAPAGGTCTLLRTVPRMAYRTTLQHGAGWVGTAAHFGAPTRHCRTTAPATRHARARPGARACS